MVPIWFIVVAGVATIFGILFVLYAMGVFGRPSAKRVELGTEGQLHIQSSPDRPFKIQKKGTVVIGHDFDIIKEFDTGDALAKLTGKTPQGIPKSVQWKKGTLWFDEDELPDTAAGAPIPLRVMEDGAIVGMLKEKDEIIDGYKKTVANLREENARLLKARDVQDRIEKENQGTVKRGENVHGTTPRNPAASGNYGSSSDSNSGRVI